MLRPCPTHRPRRGAQPPDACRNTHHGKSLAAASGDDRSHAMGPMAAGCAPETGAAGALTCTSKSATRQRDVAIVHTHEPCLNTAPLSQRRTASLSASYANVDRYTAFA